MIYHISRSDMWEKAQKEGTYCGDTLESEGFIHCSTLEQVAGTVKNYFLGQTGLLFLEIDPEKVTNEVRYEGLPGGPKFPHIYGPLNLDAVTALHPFEPDAEGKFELK
ncbi:MAG: DUF952 domain-containing protein [Chloroflexi bacterium]|nr:DUF952 domain-containing protein [Chloroflexota bacterium]